MMNIFLLDVPDDTEAITRYHVDKHVVKMPLEAAQLVSTALHVICGDGPYKKTHVNHPCAIWTRETRQNFVWTCRYGLALCREYGFRYGKTHACEAVLEHCLEQHHKFQLGELTPFACCVPEQYKSENVVRAYRSYYIFEKAHIARWTGRDVPYWWDFSLLPTNKESKL